MTRHIGIFGRRRDEETRALEAAVTAAGAKATIVDFSGFPHLNLATFDTSSAAPKASFDDLLRPGAIAVGSFDLVVLRTLCFEPFEAAAARTVDAATIACAHRRQVAKLATQQALLEVLRLGLPVLNPPQSFRFHREKAFQHQLLLRAGISTPRAIVTSDFERARAFVADLGAKVVAKPLTSGAEVVLADEEFFMSHARCDGHRPFIFQQFVKGRALRAYLLGGEVVSMGEIHYDHRHVDWRERTEEVTPCEPDAELRDQLRRAVRLLDLPYCGVDVEWDEATARHYLLDLNPAALFMGWSRLAGVDMAHLIARYALRVIGATGDPWAAGAG